MKKFILAIVFSCSVYAALPTNGTTIWEIRPSTGNNNNGGCYIAGSTGTDFSQQGSPQKAFTDLIIGGTTTQATSVASPFATTDIGNCIQVISGSGCTTGFYQIVSVTTVTATVDRSLGTGASVCTANEGGALKTIGAWNTLIVATCGGVCGWGAWVKAETTITITTYFNFNAFTQPNQGVPGAFLEGYSSTRGDGGQVTIQQTADLTFGHPIIDINGNAGGFILGNFILDCNSQATSRGLNIQGGQGVNFAFNIKITNCTITSGSMTFNSNGHTCRQCSITGSASGFLLDSGNGGNVCIECTAIGGTGPGFLLAYSSCIRCIAANNSGASSDGFQISTNSGNYLISIDQSIAYNNGRDGIRMAPGELVSITNTVLYGNAGIGINDTRNNLLLGQVFANWNAFGANTGGARSQVPVGSNDVALSGDPFTAGGSSNFAPASSAAGTQIKGTGFPGTLLVGGIGAANIGTLQSAGSSGGGISGSPITQ